MGITTVASLAGVSPGTVSNVLNQPERVREATRERVAAAMRELSYVRNESARHLRVGSSRTLGMLMRDAWNPFFTDMASAVEDVALRRGWTLFLANSPRGGTRKAISLAEFHERPTPGGRGSACEHMTEE